MFRGNSRQGFRVTTPLPTPPADAASIAERWQGVRHAERDFRTIDSLQAIPEEETAFAVWLEDDALVVLIRAEITATGSVRPGASYGNIEDIPRNDSLEIMLDPSHNHRDYLWLQWDSSGARVASRRSVMQFALRCDRVQEDEPIEPDAWSLVSEVTDDAWYSLVRIPLDLIGWQSADDLLTCGFNIVQRRYVGRYLVETSWNPLRGESQSPWDFGELLAAETPCRVAGFDFGEVYHDWNQLELEVQNLATEPQEVTAEIRAWCAGHESGDAATLTLPATGSGQAQLRFELDSREWRYQEIELMLSVDGEVSYRSHFSAGHNPRHGGAIIVLKHGVRWFEGEPPARPEPSDPDFQPKLRRWILGRLPDFPEMGWWGGAKGDWILRDRRGSNLEFNLLSPTILDELGDMIAGLFDSDEERVIAACFLAHRLVIYSPTGARVQAMLSPLASLRQGATICSGFTEVQHAILSGTPRTDGGRGYRSWWTSAHHHTIITVELPGYCTVMDPTLGGFHYIRDNSRLATIEELAADPTLSLGTLVGREEDYGPEPLRDFGWYCALPYPPEDL